MPKLAAAELFLLLTFLARVVAPTEIEASLEDELEPEAEIEPDEEDDLDPVVEPDTSLVVVVVVVRSTLPDLDVV